MVRHPLMLIQIGDDLIIGTDRRAMERLFPQHPLCRPIRRPNDPRGPNFSRRAPRGGRQKRPYVRRGTFARIDPMKEPYYDDRPLG